MNLILRNDPAWLGLLPTPDDDSTTLVFIGSDGHQVAVPASLLLAVSPLVRSSLTGLLPPAYCPCFLSLPATREVLQVVRDILATGTVAGDHVEKLEEVRQVLGMLGVEALIVSYQLESIQVGQVFDRDIREEVAAEGPDISFGDEEVKMEIIVKIEDKENTGVKASNTSSQSPRLKNVTLKSNIEADKESLTSKSSLTMEDVPPVVCGESYVYLKHDFYQCFPENGLYPSQSKRLREDFFPGIQQVNKTIVVEKQNSDTSFKLFFEALVSYKVSLGRKNTKTPTMQAVNTVNMALRQKGGGKKIPREVKDYFIGVVGQEDFNQAFINRFSEDEEFQTNYQFKLDRYKQSKHVTDESIRQFVKAAQK